MGITFQQSCVYTCSYQETKSGLQMKSCNGDVKETTIIQKDEKLGYWQMYRSLRNHINRLEKRLKSEHFCEMIEQNKIDSSRMWKSLKNALPQSANHSVSVIQSGKKVLSKPVQVAEVFNEHFTTIGQKIAKAFGKGNKDSRGILQKKTDKGFQLDLVTSNFMKIQLQNLKTNKAIGLDKISARLLKDSATS